MTFADGVTLYNHAARGYDYARRGERQWRVAGAFDLATGAVVMIARLEPQACAPSGYLPRAAVEPKLAVQVVVLSTYSPWLNPIERVWK